MRRRFQFSLRALIVLVTLASLPLGAYSYFRSQAPTIEISREKAGMPVVIRAKFLRPSLEGYTVSFLVANYDNRPDPHSCPPVYYAEAKRSWFFFCEAETEMMPWRIGRYVVHVRSLDIVLRQEFIVETIE